MTTVQRIAIENVERGIAFLDAKYPEWRNVLKAREAVDKIDMGTGKQCILSQLFGDYYAGLDFLGVPRVKRKLEQNDAFDYGFNALWWIEPETSVMTQAWRKGATA